MPTKWHTPSMHSPRPLQSSVHVRMEQSFLPVNTVLSIPHPVLHAQDVLPPTVSQLPWPEHSTVPFAV